MLQTSQNILFFHLNGTGPDPLKVLVYVGGGPSTEPWGPPVTQ